MSVSAIFGVKIVAFSPNPILRQPSHGFSGGTTSVAPPAVGYGHGNSLGLVIECSSRPQKKATAHHRKTRPRKTQAWDRNRGPAVYPPLPSLPPEWTLVTDTVVEDSSSSSPAVSE
ncbi:50S ribosomal protein 6, chloroplastic [Cynara cardunculus var. scolymus]|uniref:50S ribosomal protein 6, chloroplastic n=1 Tax=Cynara cardunculus var. scolymus TaxID=59895 RepID=A0A103XZD9_CYNCS|nr:50S ribosomal protein 6, chloroplastic [Cynara cardunculus var. scolymus]KVH99659.1 hypothetical protein Ccrd_022106 [Cynara cardunculus var. scolymus]